MVQGAGSVARRRHAAEKKQAGVGRASVLMALGTVVSRATGLGRF